MKNVRLQIRTPSRLHFGLLGWGPKASRQFGGVGLMIEDPGIRLRVESSESWVIEGLLAERVERVIHRLREQAALSGLNLSATRVCVETAPAEHVGLGVGTQLALAVTSALWRLHGLREPSLAELAHLAGRGMRSGIGLHGFVHGGLIVDGGRKSSEGSNDSDGIPPLLARAQFPTDWRILIVRPSEQNGLHGPDEIRAFLELPAIEQSVTDRLCQIILLRLLPAVMERDLESFGAAIGGIQAMVGASFAPAQGGLYSTSTANAIIAEMTRLGLAGAGQSSWGPTLYGFSDRADCELASVGEELRRQFDLGSDAILITRANNTGVEIETRYT